MKGSLIILSFFASGLLLGIFRWFPPQLLSYDISFYVLCALMFAVGISIGNDPTSIRQFRSLNPRIIFLPIMTILGTFLGVTAVSFFFKNRSITDCLAVGSGFGYYSLSSILITQCKGAELGTIALLSNIMREVLTLLLAPCMVKYFGKLSPIAAGGATTMDTTFPVIVKNSGKDYAIVSIYHGFIMDFSVPFLVTLFCSL
jgi:Predicted membrane protein